MKPLAFRMRPKKLEHIVGQQHLVAPGRIIHRMVSAKRLTSMILYGPPGIGKTSIASAIAGATDYALRLLNAATDGKKELQIVAEEAKLSGSVILLLDEVHRLDKTKQDFLLPHLESGRIILIGATTENPHIAISPAIRSRTQIFELQPLTPSDIQIGLERALRDTENGLGAKSVAITSEALTHFSRATDGDLRSALNALELAVLSTDPSADGQRHITLEVATDCLQKYALVHDKDGDAHYNTISAFQKAIRGSDVNAALHYLARLLQAGELTVACRRLLVVAYEDIGLGNPNAAARTVAAVQAAQQLGLPEARIPLANAVIDLSLSPKSNTAYKAVDAALHDLQTKRIDPIPAHLQDAHFQGAAQLKRGIDYLYPHNYPHHWVHQQYLPNNLVGVEYFMPTNTGKYEQALAAQYVRYQEWLNTPPPTS